MMEIKPASDFGDQARMIISRLFVDGFAPYFTYFSQDRDTLAAAFAHMFNVDVFYIAVLDGEPAGMAACNDGWDGSITCDAAEFRRHFGVIKGTIAGILLARELEKPPIESGKGIASVEFVVTATPFRGKGVATALLEHILDKTPFREYILEVADTNTSAIRLYKKLGFREFRRTEEKPGRKSSVGARIYMKARKKENESDRST